MRMFGLDIAHVLSIKDKILKIFVVDADLRLDVY